MEPRKLDFIKAALKNFFSELIGTAILVFLGCMGVGKGLKQEGDHTGVVLSFAFAVFIAVQKLSHAVISAVRWCCMEHKRTSLVLHIAQKLCQPLLLSFKYPATCHVSGGHVNPAVTVLSLFFKKLTIPMAAIYVCGQIIGGIIGFGFLIAITPSELLHSNGFEETKLCSTIPNPELSIVQAVLTEFLLSMILFLIVCSAWDPRNGHHDSLTIKFGFTVFSLAYAGVPYTGCSMNPARTFGPAIWNQTWKHHWIYWVAPFSAALFCGFFYTTFFCPSVPSLKECPEKSDRKDDLEMNS